LDLYEIGNGDFLKSDDDITIVGQWGDWNFEGAVIGGDGSGGEQTSDPRLRRCGWSAVLIQSDPVSPVYGLPVAAIYGPLLGHQSVARAELNALLQICCRTSGLVTYYIDCESVF
jgi:hypothetical protein